LSVSFMKRYGGRVSCTVRPMHAIVQRVRRTTVSSRLQLE
jgi:hypothetical protein